MYKYPPELDLTPLENQCIARGALLIEIIQFLKTNMKGRVDRKIHIPIEDAEVMNTIKILPRKLDKSSMVGINFNRMKDMKNVHMKGYLRPTKMYQALVILKVPCNHYYHSLVKKCIY